VPKKVGRPKKELDYKLIEELASIFCTQEEIATILGVNRSTLFRDEQFSNIYSKGHSVAKQSLRRKQFKLADTNAYMAVFLGKQYLGQKDNVDNENENVPKTVDFNFTIITDASKS
jgi:hypothetical protein